MRDLLKRERSCERKARERRGRMTRRDPESIPIDISTWSQMPALIAVSNIFGGCISGELEKKRAMTNRELDQTAVIRC